MEHRCKALAWAPGVVSQPLYRLTTQACWLPFPFESLRDLEGKSEPVPHHNAVCVSGRDGRGPSEALPSPRCLEAGSCLLPGISEVRRPRPDLESGLRAGPGGLCHRRPFSCPPAWRTREGALIRCHFPLSSPPSAAPRVRSGRWGWETKWDSFRMRKYQAMCMTPQR